VTDGPFPTLGNVLTGTMSTRAGRVGILTAWAWIGLPFAR
jgi:hypothetical protein